MNDLTPDFFVPRSPPCADSNSPSPYPSVIPGTFPLSSTRLSHTSVVVTHAPPSFPPTLLGPISSPLHYGSGHTPHSRVPRPFFASVVKTDHYQLTTTTPLLLPTFRISTVAALTADFPRVTRHPLFYLVPSCNPTSLITLTPSIHLSVPTVSTLTSLPSPPSTSFSSPFFGPFPPPLW